MCFSRFEIECVCDAIKANFACLNLMMHYK